MNAAVRAVTYRYSCANCGGAVRKHHQVFKTYTPARDERGKVIEELVRDRETGKQITKEKLVEHEARGLGHWRCEGTCKRRPTKVLRSMVAAG